MTIENRPAEYEFAGNLADMKVTGITSPVTFVLSADGVQIVEEICYPDPAGIATIRMRDLLEIAVSCPAMTVGAQPAVVYTWSITGEAAESGSFRCLKGGHLAGVDAATYLKTNFLTWQPQTRTTLYHIPHWLRYVAVVAGCRFRVKGYYTDGTSATFDLTGELAAGSIYTVDATYGAIRGLFDRQITYYDIWIESNGTALTWVQRYVLADGMDGTPDHFVFENSLGGFDTVCFRGDRKDVAEPESLNAAFDDRTLEYDVDWQRSFQKNTGYFPDLNTRLWALDFFSSANRYHLSDGVLHRIVVNKPKLEATEGELAGYEFTYAYAKQSRYMNLPRVPVPPALEIVNPAGELFFLEPRLNQFRRADATVGDILIPVQYAHSPEWMAITLFDILKLAGGEGSGGLWDIILDTLSKKYDKAGGPIRGNVQIEEDDEGSGGHLDVQHTATATQMIARKEVVAPEFLSGWSGMGFQIWQREDGKWIAEFDGVRARDFFEATEFIINKARAVGGELFVTNCNKSVGMTVFDARLFVDGVLNGAENGLLPLDGIFGEC